MYMYSMHLYKHTYAHIMVQFFFLGGGECDVTLQDILVFFTGSDTVPPLGFPVTASLNFNDQNPYPTASTCSIYLLHTNQIQCLPRI